MMTPNQQNQIAMVTSAAAGGANGILAWFDVYGPVVSTVVAITSGLVLVTSFTLDQRRKIRQETREIAERDRKTRQEAREIAEHERLMSNET